MVTVRASHGNFLFPMSTWSQWFSFDALTKACPLSPANFADARWHEEGIIWLAGARMASQDVYATLVNFCGRHLKISNPSNLPHFNNTKIHLIRSTNSNASNLDSVFIPPDPLAREHLTSRLTQGFHFSVVSYRCSVLSQKYHSRY